MTENKGDLISREALKKAIEQGEGFSWDNYGKDDLCVRKKYIDNAPPVEQKYYERVIAQINPVIEARPQGEWKHEVIGDKSCVLCNQCFLHFDCESNFCPNCGASMTRCEKNE